MLNWLAQGNLTSDGISNQVVALVSANLELLPELVACLQATDPAVRGHAADALEKLARLYPEQIQPFLPDLIRSVHEDTVAIVHMHLAMIFGHLTVFPAHIPELAETLFYLLESCTPFTQSWAIVSLCLLARGYPEYTGQVLAAITPLSNSNSRALCTRVRHALPLLLDPHAPFPKGWVKSQHLQHLV